MSSKVPWSASASAVRNWTVQRKTGSSGPELAVLCARTNKHVMPKDGEYSTEKSGRKTAVRHALVSTEHCSALTKNALPCPALK
ncbi:hypothetical protein ElyMa_004706400 [Elysia marginata]|uniref:Uncharacterized protein n=1 Tax=Elysia marginata TaxID=1093978 RepID=A0AAV4I7N9_9GAST|nr:hypothetical protein ElyMa_004706400 [Elysia marginata]